VARQKWGRTRPVARKRLGGGSHQNPKDRDGLHPKREWGQVVRAQEETGGGGWGGGWGGGVGGGGGGGCLVGWVGWGFLGGGVLGLGCFVVGGWVRGFVL